MLRKKLTPSWFRRCAVFLAVGGAMAWNVGRVQGGLALESSSDDQAGLMAPDMVGGHRLVSNTSIESPLAGHVSAPNSPQVANPSEVAGPGLTGENWFQGLQQGVDQAFEPQGRITTPEMSTQKQAATTVDNSVKANAIPSLPSFWSGLTCCLALVIAGMFPRVRRVLR